MKTDAPNSATHVRLPTRADAVAGPEAVPGAAAKPIAKPDPKTASQDPVRK